MTLPTNRLSTFFKGDDTELGVFYPKNYLLAVFPSLDDACLAMAELHRRGRLEEHMIAASGEEVVRYAQEHLDKGGIWGMLMSELSRTIGTAALYADRDLAAAKEGKAFVAVLCPNEKVKAEAWKVLEPTHPLVARYYTSGGIEHLVGEY